MYDICENILLKYRSHVHEPYFLNFLKCHTFFPTVIFYFFSVFLVLNEENQMCLELIFTFQAQVLEHSSAILMVHFKHRDTRYLSLGEIPWNTLYVCDSVICVKTIFNHELRPNFIFSLECSLSSLYLNLSINTVCASIKCDASITCSHKCLIKFLFWNID